MIAADKLISKRHPKAKMILQIHDELLFEVPARDAEEFLKDIKAEMEGIYKLSVPLVVDVKIGDNWGEI
jgi:DNA polymerase-1